MPRGENTCVGTVIQRLAGDIAERLKGTKVIVPTWRGLTPVPNEVVSSLAKIVGLSVAALAAMFAPIAYGSQGSQSLYFGVGTIGVVIGLVVWPTPRRGPGGRYNREV